jgi:hypothetical protein
MLKDSRALDGDVDSATSRLLARLDRPGPASAR